MKQIRLTRPTIFGGIVILFVMLGVFWWLSPKHNQTSDVADNSDTPVTIQQENDMSDKTTFSSNGEMETLKMIQTKYAPIEAELERGLRNLRSEPITAADRAEVAQMLAKLEPLDAKSEMEIAQILVGFYPEEKRGEWMVEVYTQYYQDLSEIGESYFTKEQKVLKMVHFAQKNLSTLRQMEKEVAEQVQRDMELKDLEPDAYYAAKIQEYEAKIQETEKSIREAEARGDMDSAESERKHLAVLHEFIEDTKSDQEWEQGQEARIQEGIRKALQEWEQNPPEWVKEHQRYMVSIEKLKTELSALKSRDTAPATSSDGPVSFPQDPPVLSQEPSVLPQEPSMLPSDTYDPIKSLTSAQATLQPWRSALDEDYFDVVASQHLTPQELHQYFPTQEERQILKRRTSEMQKTVVSKIRKVVSEIPNATQAQKSKLARELVTANFDKDFADAVIEQLQLDQK